MIIWSSTQPSQSNFLQRAQVKKRTVPSEMGLIVRGRHRSLGRQRRHTINDFRIKFTFTISPTQSIHRCPNTHPSHQIHSPLPRSPHILAHSTQLPRPQRSHRPHHPPRHLRLPLQQLSLGPRTNVSPVRNRL